MNIKVHFNKRDIAHLIQVGYKKSSLLKNKKALFLTFLIVCTTSLIQAQRNPVEVMATIAPPYTPYLAEYGTATSNHLQVTVLANDSRLVNLPVKLQIEVENMQTGTLFKTRQQANTPILYLSGGSVLNLSGLDLSSYFQAQNLMFYGMDMSRYLTGKRIPDGYYRIGFTIVDANRGQVISNTAYTNPGWFLLNNPPQLNLPRRNEVLRIEGIQSVKFEWYPRHLGSMNSSFGTSYTFELYTMRVPDIQPAQYVNSAMPDYKVDVSSTNLRLSMGDYPLEKGVRYAWRVQAKANNVLSMFLNDGYSEVSSFTYGSSCPAPEDVQVNVLNTEDVSFSCLADPLHTAYNIRIKKSNDNDGWYTREFYTANFDIKSMMEAGTLYKYQLAAKCNTEASEYSALQEFRMKTAENTTIECGREDQAVAIINDVPKPNLVIGDYITNGPWELLITEVSGGDGTFSGKGRLRVPWFLNAKVRMKFDNIQVNEHNQVTAGMFESITDTTGRFFVEDVSDYLGEGDQYGNVLTGREHAGLELGYAVPDVSQLNVDYNNGNVTVSSGDGSSGTMEIDDPEDGIIISDCDGSIFAANKDGEVVKIGEIEEPGDEDDPTAGTGESYKENKSTYDNLSGTSSITVTFENADDWALDHWDPDYGSSAFNSEYEEFGGQYVPWKYIPIGIPGKVKYKVSGDLPSGGELVFRTPAGTRYLPQDNNILTLASARDRDALEIYALVQQDDSIIQSLGKLKVASYPKIRHKVKLVPMYDATIDGSKVQEEVNKIYKPYGIVWEVEVKEPFTDSSWDEGEEGLQTSGSGFFSELTPEMKALNAAYQKEPDFDSESLYLFIFNQQSSDNKNMLGDMPLQSQFGYIFMQDNEGLYHTIAHEVAHGMFQLRHPFSNRYGLQEMATNNLLDYKGGTELKKYQWDAIHDPQKTLAWAQDEEEGAAIIEFPTCTRMEIERFRAAYIHGNSVSFTKDKGLGYSADDITMLDGKEYEVIGISVSEDVDFWPHTVRPTVEIRNEYAYFNLGNGVEFYTSEDDYRNKGIENYFFLDNETKKQNWETQLDGLKQSILNNLKEDNQSKLLKELAILPESETARLTDKEKDEILNYLATVNSKPLFSCVEWQDIFNKVSVSSKGDTPLKEYSSDWVIKSITQFIKSQDEDQDIVEFYNTYASGDIRKEGVEEDNYFLYQHSKNGVNLYANTYTNVGAELSGETEMSFDILSYEETIEFNIDFEDLVKEQLILRFKVTDLANFESQFNELGFDGTQMKEAMTNRLWAELYKTKDFHEFRTLVKYIPGRLSHDEKTKCINIIYDESGGKLTTDEHNIICSLIENVNSSDDAEKMVAWLKDNSQILDKLFGSIDDWSADKFPSIAETILVLYYKQDKGTVITEGKKVSAENLFEWNPLGNTEKFQFDIPESWTDYWAQAKEIRDNVYTISYGAKYENNKFVITPTYHYVGYFRNHPTSFDPFETVSVYFATDNKYIKAGGWTVPMPSIYLAWLINQGTRETNQAMLTIGTTAASMMFGIGELKLALEGSKYIKVAITGTLLIKGINDFLLKNKLYKDEISELLGRNFVSNYEAVSNIIDIVLISKQTVTGELEEKVNALASAWGKIDEHNLKQLEEKYPELYELINREIEKIKTLQ